MKPEATKQEPGGRCAGCWRPLVLMGLSVLVTAVVLEILLRLGGGGRPAQFNAALASATRAGGLSAMSVKTTNCNPISAPADEPTMT